MRLKWFEFSIAALDHGPFDPIFELSDVIQTSEGHPMLFSGCPSDSYSVSFFM